MKDHSCMTASGLCFSHRSLIPLQIDQVRTKKNKSVLKFVSSNNLRDFALKVTSSNSKSANLVINVQNKNIFKTHHHKCRTINIKQQ